MRLLVLHGPNAALLAEHAGTSLESLDAALRRRASALGATLHLVHSNHEGALLDALAAERTRAHGVLVSPGPLALSGHALAEALRLLALPAVEVHPGPLRGRKSLLKDVCLAQLSGKGVDSYLLGLERLVKAAAKGATAPTAGKREDAHVQTGKTLGRKPVNRLVEKEGRAEVSKTLGRKPAAARPPTHTLASKTLGRAAHLAGEDEAAQLLSRALVRQKIAERLSGRLSPAGLATWARTHWLEVQRGAPAESGQRELLEDTLQRLTLSTLPASKLSDEQLIELMTQLDT